MSKQPFKGKTKSFSGKSSANDQSLIRKIVEQKDKKALAALYKKYFADVYAFVYSKIGSKEQTEDIVSDTWLALLENLQKFDDTSTFKTFAFGFALNMTRRFYQSNKNVPAELDEESLILEEKPQTRTKVSKLIKKVNQVLKKLTENYRQILETRFLEGKNIKQTATLLNISESNVRVLQHRAIKKAQEIANKLNLND